MAGFIGERMSFTESHLILNGKLCRREEAKVSFLSEAVLYGYGCFETMYWTRGQGIRYESMHRDRMGRATRAMGLEVAMAKLPLGAWADELAKYHDLDKATARLSIHKEGVQVHTLFRLFIGSEVKSKVVSIHKSSFPHPGYTPLSSYKHNNYLLNLLALQAARLAGYDEALLCREDEVIEGSVSNVFIYKDDRLVTPPLPRGPLAGVIREKLLQAGDKLPVLLVEEKITLADITEADALFLTNATRGILRATRFEDQEFASNPAEDLQARLEAALEESNH